MNRMLYLITALLCLSSFHSLLASPVLQVDPKLSHYVKTIQKFPEGQELISNVLKGGPLNIILANDDLTSCFSACWETETRTIRVSLESLDKGESIFGSIIFELHNALASPQFKYLDQTVINGTKSKEEYIRSLEYLEYNNSINAAKIINLGIEKGLFPKSAFLPTYKSFEEHFYYQKLSHHSDVFGENYDIILENHRRAHF